MSLAALVVTLAAAAACGGSGTKVDGTPPAEVTGDPGDGSVPTNEPTNESPTSRADPCDPSPSGKIAFHASPAGQSNTDIYVADNTGECLKRLTDDPAIDWQPSWSPDGTRIAFVSSRDLTNTGDRIYVMNADGSGVIASPEVVGSIQGLDWSPDGSRITFGLDGGIYIANVDGSKVEWLADGAQPDWSPDGSRIAYHSALAGELGLDVYAVHTDGTRKMRLTEHKANDGFPAWSPDGSRIAFISDREDDVGVYIKEVGGSGLSRVAEDLGQSFFGLSGVSWSPDGSRIAFQRLSFGIFTMNADGSSQAPLFTDMRVFGEAPDWSPVP